MSWFVFVLLCEMSEAQDIVLEPKPAFLFSTTLAISLCKASTEHMHLLWD